MQDAMITTAFELPGYTINKNLGVVRGITVRSRSIVGNIFGALQSLFGGNITIY
ncbi:MAG: heavy metal-binding domain-containing protein, partial [Burkholderiaceae bacterium]